MTKDELRQHILSENHVILSREYNPSVYELVVIWPEVDGWGWMYHLTGDGFSDKSFRKDELEQIIAVTAEWINLGDCTVKTTAEDPDAP